jgi:hypothetical protein
MTTCALNLRCLLDNNFRRENDASARYAAGGEDALRFMRSAWRIELTGDRPFV